MADNKRLNGKVALVTGGSRGIGKAIALRLAAEGASVAIGYRESAEKANVVVNELKALGSDAMAIQADMADVPQIRALFENAHAHFGKLNILINNAGVGWFNNIADITEDEYDRMFAVNCRGVFFAMQEAARRLADNGRIVNISSGVTILGSAGASIYAGTKAAIDQFAMAAAKELGKRGITANTVLAGLTATEMLDTVVPKDVQQMIAAGSPFGRIGQPEDVADVVCWLCTEEAHWITAQSIRATGGAA